MSKKTGALGGKFATLGLVVSFNRRGWRRISLPAEECPHRRRQAHLQRRTLPWPGTIPLAACVCRPAPAQAVARAAWQRPPRHCRIVGGSTLIAPAWAVACRESRWPTAITNDFHRRNINRTTADRLQYALRAVALARRNWRRNDLKELPHWTKNIARETHHRLLCVHAPSSATRDSFDSPPEP